MDHHQQQPLHKQQQQQQSASFLAVPHAVPSNGKNHRVGQNTETSAAKDHPSRSNARSNNTMKGVVGGMVLHFESLLHSKTRPSKITLKKSSAKRSLPARVSPFYIVSAVLTYILLGAFWWKEAFPAFRFMYLCLTIFSWNVRSPNSPEARQQREQYRRLLHTKRSASLHSVDETSSSSEMGGTTGNDASSGPSVVFAGLVRTTGEVQPETWELLVNFTCRHQIPVHMFAGQGLMEGRKEYERRRAAYLESSGTTSCASWTLDDDTHIGSLQKHNVTHRILRLIAVRDQQRELVRSMLQGPEAPPTASFSTPYGDDPSLRHKYVITADLDLAILPTSDDYMERLDADLFGADGLCAMGNNVIIPSIHEYYDQVATIIWPQSYTMPLHFRLESWIHPGEDPYWITTGSFRSPTLTHRIVNQGMQDPRGLVRAQSCYGGTAIYRASVYLHQACRYLTDEATQQRLKRYAARWDGVPGDHVIFHDCLHRQYSSFNKDDDDQSHKGVVAQTSGRGEAVDEELLASTLEIAIDTMLHTRWKPDILIMFRGRYL